MEHKMAKVTVKNFREHQIDLNLKDKDGTPITITIPALSKQPDEEGELQDVPGSVQIDEAVLTEARKNNAAIEAYFAEKYLRVLKAKAPANNVDNPEGDKTPPAAPPAPPATPDA
jgi:hypothetical protein